MPHSPVICHRFLMGRERHGVKCHLFLRPYFRGHKSRSELEYTPTFRCVAMGKNFKPFLKQ